MEGSIGRVIHGHSWRITWPILDLKANFEAYLWRQSWTWRLTAKAIFGDYLGSLSLDANFKAYHWRLSWTWRPTLSWTKSWTWRHLTWAFGAALEQPTKPEDHSAFVLLNNLNMWDTNVNNNVNNLNMWDTKMIWTLRVLNFGGSAIIGAQV